MSKTTRKKEKTMENYDHENTIKKEIYRLSNTNGTKPGVNQSVPDLPRLIYFFHTIHLGLVSNCVIHFNYN